MTDQSDPLPVATSWDTYWQGAHSSAAYTSGGTSLPLILSFWNNYFRDIKSRYDNPRIIDIASGNGAVVESASTIYAGQLPGFACLDISAAAIDMLKERFPDVQGVVADATAIPLDSETYDIATSQFGIEYAGDQALAEMIRLIAPGGELALLLHHREGIIYRQCAASAAAIGQMQNAQFIPLCIAMFKAGFAALGGGDRADYKAASKAFAPAIRALEAIMKQHGRDVADGTILKLYRDIRTTHNRMRNFEPSEVIGWLDSMQGEIEAYAGRMTSMCDAAIDAAAFDKLCAGLPGQGLSIVRAEPLAVPHQDTPLAWTLIAKKG